MSQSALRYSGRAAPWIVHVNNRTWMAGSDDHAITELCLSYLGPAKVHALPYGFRNQA
jgi:hypothetical protein